MLRTRRFSLPGPVDLGLTLGPLRCGFGDPRIRLGRTEAWRAAHTPEGPATLHLTLHGTAVEATAWGSGAAWVLEEAPGLLGAADHPEGFRPADEVMRSLARRAHGLRLTRSLGFYELLVPTILEQKVTSIEARRSFTALVKRYGPAAPGPGSLRLLPPPEELAALPYFAFHPFGIERKRAEILRTIARRAGRLEEAACMSAPDALTRLMALPGIGPWTATVVTGAALGEPDVVVRGDLHLPSLAAWALAGEPRADDDRMLELLEPYRGHRARAMRYIVTSGPRPPRFGPRKRLRELTSI